MPKARPVHSRQLRLMLDALSDGRPHSAWDLCICARTSDPTTILRELRQHGYEIPHRIEGGRHLYQLTTPDLNRLIAQQRADLEARAAKLAQAAEESAA
jgi:hypothetical protein